MAQEEAITKEEAIRRIKAWNLDTDDLEVLSVLIPELRESEDEEIRKLLVWQVHRNIEDETNDLAGSVYDGIKGHDPDLEESIEDWKKCLDWLERQKEQKPVHTAKEIWEEMRLEIYAQASGNRHEPNCSDDSTKMFSLRDIDEIFEKIGNATIGSRPAELEQLAKLKEMTHEIREAYERGYEVGCVGSTQEWSEEEERILDGLIRLYSREYSAKAWPWADGVITYGDVVNFLNSLKSQPHWKPSEEQIEALEKTTWLANFGTDAKRRDALLSLYAQLKKLM